MENTFACTVFLKACRLSLLSTINATIVKHTTIKEFNRCTVLGIENLCQEINTYNQYHMCIRIFQNRSICGEICM